ncbi:MAG: FadR family transcriptional regulator, partial [Firmicutes bacterium]|nr:FadR family transcriptional regulator [Bacillota bacterium]
DLDGLLQLKQASLADISEARRLNEAASAELAAIRRTEEVHLLQQTAKTTLGVTSSKDRRLQLTVNGSFHEVLAKATHNPVLFTTTMSLFPLLEGALAEQPTPVPKEKQQHLYEDHCQLVEAIRVHDPDQAKQITQRHLIYLESEVYDLSTPL